MGWWGNLEAGRQCQEAGKPRHELEGSRYRPLSVPTEVAVVKSQSSRAPGCLGDQATLQAEGG